MMNFLELAQKRESVRSFCSDVPSKDKLEYIEECVRMAPSAVNFQPWKFYFVTDIEACDKLRSCYSRSWFNEAPMYIVACVNHKQEWTRKKDQVPHGTIDVAIAVEHLCLAATEVGLGTCWVCNFDASLCKQLFDFAEDEEPVVLIPIGYPKTEQATEKNRKDVTEIFSNIRVK